MTFVVLLFNKSTKVDTEKKLRHRKTSQHKKYLTSIKNLQY